MIEVTLEWFEVKLAAEVGLNRNIDKYRSAGGWHHRAGHEQGERNAWQQNIEGALGELAYAKARGRYWNGSVNTFKNGGDVGEVQVRTRSHHAWELLVREGDRDADAFVLVTGVAPIYRVHGWLYGRDAKKPEWLKDHGGHGAAYFVPQEALVAIA